MLLTEGAFVGVGPSTCGLPVVGRGLQGFGQSRLGPSLEATVAAWVFAGRWRAELEGRFC